MPLGVLGLSHHLKKEDKNPFNSFMLCYVLLCMIRNIYLQAHINDITISLFDIQLEFMVVELSVFHFHVVIEPPQGYPS